MCHVSHIRCHVSGVMCQLSLKLDCPLYTTPTEQERDKLNSFLSVWTVSVKFCIALFYHCDATWPIINLWVVCSFVCLDRGLNIQTTTVLLHDSLTQRVPIDTHIDTKYIFQHEKGVITLFSIHNSIPYFLFRYRVQSFSPLNCKVEMAQWRGRAGWTDLNLIKTDCW